MKTELVRALNPGTFGTQMGECFHLSEAPTLIASPSARAQLAVTRISSEVPLASPTLRISPEQAFVISVHLSPADYQDHQVWIEGKLQRTPSWKAGAVGVYNLEHDPIWSFNQAFDHVLYHFPRALLDDFTDANAWRRVETLRCAHGAVHPILHRLTQMILPVLQRDREQCELFLDHFRFLFCAYVVEHFGGVIAPAPMFKGGLAPWQKRRVGDMLNAHLDGNLRLVRLAAECGLSVSHFARSFKASFGTTVHQYLLSRRVEVAKSLLSKPESCLADVANRTGFSDQPAFTKTFRALVGTTPGRWKREAVHKVFAGG